MMLLVIEVTCFPRRSRSSSSSIEAAYKITAQQTKITQLSETQKKGNKQIINALLQIRTNYRKNLVDPN